MLEVFLMLFAGVILYSIFQGIRRGNVSPEERKNNPTLIERSSTFIDEMADVATQLSVSSSKYLEETRFELGYCGWFRDFENSVSGALDVAERFTAIDKELRDNPGLKKMYDKVRNDLNSTAGGNKAPSDLKKNCLKDQHRIG